MRTGFTAMRRIERNYRVSVLLLLSGLWSAWAHADVLVGGTRFVYAEQAQNGIAVPLRNLGRQASLIKTQIIPFPAEGQGKYGSPETVPFVPTPPLFVLGAGHENTLRIRYTGGLPTDRESIYQLIIAAIPAGKPESNSLQIAVRTRLKLFYRPKGLNADPAQAYTHLRWHRIGHSVIVENPTPYYVTLVNLKANGQPIPDAGMVPPFGNRTTSWCHGLTHCQLQWQALSDYGRVMPAWQKSMTFVAGIGSVLPEKK